MNKELRKEMTLNDLKTGMKVELRGGDILLVVRSCSICDIDYMGIFLRADGNHSTIWANFSDYSDDLIESNDMDNWDIMKVYEPKNSSVIFEWDENKHYLIWGKK
jgi:hypothetical protein